jgi:hypothetical protein
MAVLVSGRDTVLTATERRRTVDGISQLFSTISVGVIIRLVLNCPFSPLPTLKFYDG